MNNRRPIPCNANKENCNKPVTRLRLKSESAALCVPRLSTRERIKSDNARPALGEICKNGREARRAPIIPQRKYTLTNQVRGRQPIVHMPFSFDIYCQEYLNDIIFIAKRKEVRFVLPNRFYEQHNTSPDKRTGALDWFVTMHEKMCISKTMHYMAVHLFDLVLSRKAIASNMYRLVIIAIAWIVLKYHDDTKVLRARNFMQLCNKIYLPSQLLPMERKLLSLFQFRLHIVQPDLFANYYLFKLNVKLEDIITFMTHYAIESFTLSPLYSTFEPSRIAAAAVHIAITKMYPDRDMYSRISHIFGYYGPSKLRVINEKMIQNLQMCLHKSSPIFAKYNTAQMKFASLKLTRCIFRNVVVA